jgi:hypothetical protein
VYSASLLTNYDYQLQLPTTMTNYIYQLHLPTTITNDIYQLRLPTTFTNYDCQLHLPTTIANYIYQLRLPTTFTNYDYKRHLQLYYVTHYPISHPFPDNRENAQKAHIMGYYPIDNFYMHYLRYITVLMQGDTISVYSVIVNAKPKPIRHPH